jgi:hypothetical protein
MVVLGATLYLELAPAIKVRAFYHCMQIGFIAAEWVASLFRMSKVKAVHVVMMMVIVSAASSSSSK